MTHTVSIPLWFLRNERASETLERFFVFPYHYGSYATREVFETEEERCVVRFHTTMVLTQLRYAISSAAVLFVSIPLWFLRNGEV